MLSLSTLTLTLAALLQLQLLLFSQALERVGGVHEVHALTGGIEELKSGMYREIASLATGFQEAVSMLSPVDSSSN